MKMKIDLHTHTNFSPDCAVAIERMLERAQKNGVAFYGVSDHIEYHMPTAFNPAPEKEEAYFHHARHLQEDYAGCMNVLIGVEFGYTENPLIWKRIEKTCEKYAPDFVINSVHDVELKDYYYKKPFENTDKPTAYSTYLRLVRNSLDVSYPYDIVGHLGYLSRYAPYENRRVYVAEFYEQIDDILQTIIQKGKILEINSSNKDGVEAFLPERAILERYYALGGRKICFGSDAHDRERIAEKHEQAVALLKEMGFTHFTVPCKGEEIKIEL